jgi:HSP20 family protein
MLALNSILRRDGWGWEDAVNELSKTHLDLLSKSNNIPTAIEKTDEFHNIYAEIPGFSKEDVKITVKNNILKVNANRKRSNVFVGEKSLELVFELPFGRSKYDVKGINATVENGILHVSVPYEKPVEPEEITIKIK